jgi:hypothetical protein
MTSCSSSGRLLHPPTEQIAAKQPNPVEVQAISSCLPASSWRGTRGGCRGTSGNRRPLERAPKSLVPARRSSPGFWLNVTGRTRAPPRSAISRSRRFVVRLKSRLRPVHGSNSNSSMSMTRVDVVKARRTVSPRVTPRVAEQARLDIAEIVWSVVVPIVAVCTAVRCRNGAHSKNEEAKHTYCEKSSHGQPRFKLLVRFTLICSDVKLLE